MLNDLMHGPFGPYYAILLHVDLVRPCFWDLPRVTAPPPVEHRTSVGAMRFGGNRELRGPQGAIIRRSLPTDLEQVSFFLPMATS